MLFYTPGGRHSEFVEFLEVEAHQRRQPLRERGRHADHHVLNGRPERGEGEALLNQDPRAALTRVVAAVSAVNGGFPVTMNARIASPTTPLRASALRHTLSVRVGVDDCASCVARDQGQPPGTF